MNVENIRFLGFNQNLGGGVTMVSIVSHNPHPSVVKEKLCKNCGCTLSYVPNDVKTRIETDYTGCKDSIQYITCPSCSKDVTVGFY